MKSLGASAAAADRAIRHRKFEWCRLRNEFIDLPLWRVVADRLGMPLYQVQAFVTRLDSFANASIPRGYVGEFSAVQFAAALGMPVDDATRLYAALEDKDIEWIVQDHVLNFWERNPDKEDKTAAERQQRKRDRTKAMKVIARRAKAGLLTPAQRVLEEAQVLGLETSLSTVTESHAVTHRDSVTVTPRAEHSYNSPSVDSSVNIAHRDSNRTPEEENQELFQDPDVWLAREGRKIVVERGGAISTRAELEIARWLRELIDVPDAAEGLKRAIAGADAHGAVGGKFYDVIRSEVLRLIIDSRGRQLPLTTIIRGRAANG